MVRMTPHFAEINSILNDITNAANTSVEMALYTLWGPDIPKRLFWQTVKTQMKCHNIWHFICLSKFYLYLFDLIFYVISTNFQLCREIGMGLPVLNQY